MSLPEEILKALDAVGLMDPLHRLALLDELHHEVQVRRGPLMQPIDVLRENIQHMLFCLGKAAEASDSEKNDAFREVLSQVHRQLGELDYHVEVGPRCT